MKCNLLMKSYEGEMKGNKIQKKNYIDKPDSTEFFHFCIKRINSDNLF